MDVKLLVRGLWDRLAGWLLIGFGVLLLLLGWMGVSDTVLPSEQIPYVMSGGLGGIACIGIGGTLLLSADLRDEWRKLDELEQVLGAQTEHQDQPEDAPAGANGNPRERAAARRPLKATTE